jgi:murein DD-endopeptidase MepM/ murein hydrolase activator NlpD
MSSRRKRFHPYIVGGFFGGLGFLLARGLTHAFESEEVESKETTYVDPKAKPRNKKMPLQNLIAPLTLPFRQPTPHGYYGARRPTDSSKPKDHEHQGVDLPGADGETILAVGDGKIVVSDPGIGQLVRVLLLDDGRAVVYADLGTADVQPGTILKAGSKVGTIKKHDPKTHTGGFVHVAIRESRFGKFMDPTGIIPYDSTHLASKAVS